MQSLEFIAICNLLNILAVQAAVLYICFRSRNWIVLSLPAAVLANGTMRGIAGVKEVPLDQLYHVFAFSSAIDTLLTLASLVYLVRCKIKIPRV